MPLKSLSIIKNNDNTGNKAKIEGRGRFADPTLKKDEYRSTAF